MKKNNRVLGLAVAAGLLAGIYTPFAYAAETTVYTDTITGNKEKDGQYVDVIQADGKYLFNADSKIEINDAQYAIHGENDLLIDAVGKDLALKVTPSNSAAKGVYVDNATTTTINAKNLNVYAESEGDAIGIAAENKNGGKGNIVINGNVFVNAKSTGVNPNGATTGNLAVGIYSKNNSEITINGDVAMKGENGSWGVTTADDGGPSYRVVAGIMAVENGKVNINGDVDLKIRGAGVTADGKGSEINLKGGTIVVDPNYVYQSNKLGDRVADTFSMISRGGVINMNMNDAKDGAGDSKKIKIVGNLGLMGSFSIDKADINIGLSDYDSSFTGAIYVDKNIKNSGANLYFSNGATWINEYYGRTDLDKIANSDSLAKKFKGSVVNNFVGGPDAKHVGGIFQKDKNKLTINNCSGNIVIVYDRKGYGTKAEDYIGGDTVIKHAEAGTVVTLSTPTFAGDKNHNTFIDIENTSNNTLNAILNGLAGKLIYEGAIGGKETNLIGKVQIASGLSASSYGRVVGDITFDPETGKGSHFYEPDYTFQNDISGILAEDQPYVNAGVTSEKDGFTNYIFDGNKNVSILGTNYDTIKLKKDTVINTGKGDLILQVLTGDKDGHGINIYKTGADLNLTANRLIIDVDSAQASAGIDINNNNADKSNVVIDADVSINVAGSGNADSVGIYGRDNSEITVNGNVTMEKYDSWGIYHVNHTGPSWYTAVGIMAQNNALTGDGGYGGKININGDVNLKIRGTGVAAYGNYTEVNLKGGTIITDDNYVISTDALGDRVVSVYSLASKGGTINMNMNDTKDGASDNTVEIKGNIGFYGSGTLLDIKESTINLGLSNKESSLKGVVFNEVDPKKTKAAFNLYLSNGATWNNEYHGNLDAYNNKEIGKFKGSKVEKLVGGSDAEHAGYIVQKDTHDLTINNYSGHSVLFYEHEGDGTNAKDYKAGNVSKADYQAGKDVAGNTVINSAASGSSIVVSTGNNGITIDNKVQVAKVLDTLAGKLYYNGAIADKENNLVGKVQIASGLTAASAGKVIGDMNFDKTNGQGNYVEGSMNIVEDKPVPPVDPDKPVNPDKPGDIEYGDYESYMMQGARTAMTDAMLSWRDVAADSFVRTSELRNGSEEGAWIRVFGGETKYEGRKTDVSGNYYAVQTGFDKEFGNGWNAGLMFDYKDGESDYLLSGEGDYKTYTVGVYGTKDFNDGSYLDLSAKFGQVKNNYTVYNEIGQKLEGEYKAPGYAVSAQYGKRIANGNRYFEPQVQLTWAHVNGDSYDAHSGAAVLNINQDAFDSFVGRVGVETGRTSDRGALYARLSLNHEFSGDVNGTYNAKDGGLKNTSFDVAGTWTDFTLGGNYNLSRCSNFYADVTKSLAGDYKQDWKVNAGFSFTF